jgi:hypothetical protein
LVWGFESGFSGFRGFFSVGRWFGVLNQDLQDFEDFLALGVGWYGACCSSKYKINYPPFFFAAAIIAAAKYHTRGTHFR